VFNKCQVRAIIELNLKKYFKKKISPFLITEWHVKVDIEG